MSYAPILLFLYNRPEHTRMAIDSLSQNSLAKESEPFIYSDAAQDEKTQPVVDEVRKVIHTVSNFAKITVIPNFVDTDTFQMQELYTNYERFDKEKIRSSIVNRFDSRLTGKLLTNVYR